ncbi:coiled-coil domain-containing protein 106-like [Xyrauchen texanus]|uniref:coiled-coil domain-containing protein 106-like n=1 Tax=Xyrauchen texanus TaxID=154827 RepID=UPI00224215BA|nr:coiled-coil domain-containing protein 106-like [Xyrauchen texanus]
MKNKEEISILKSKIKVLEDKCRDLESERDFLRSSLTNALSTKDEMQGAFAKTPSLVVNPDSSDEEDGLHEENKKAKRRARKEKKKKSKIVDSSSFSDESVSYSTSESSVSSSPHKSRKHKKKSEKKAKRKMQKSRRVFLPEHAIQRYKKVLQYLQQGITKTLAYHKCGVDRKTIVDTAAISELEACDVEAYKTLRETFHRGQKLSQFAEQCKEMCMKEPLRSVIVQKKTNGLLIDLCQKKK